MRLKLITAALLVFAISVGLKYWLRPVVPASVPATAAPGLELATAAPANRVFLVHGIKMNLVTDQPWRITAKFAGNVTNNWNLILTITNPKGDYWSRMNAIDALKSGLSADDWRMLQKFLLQTDPFDQTKVGQVLKNNLMTALCNLNPPPSELGNVLADIYGDHKQDSVIRDYAIQHIGEYYEQISGRKYSLKPLQSVSAVLWSAVNEPVGSVGGTALLTLNRLSEEFPSTFDRQKIADTALQMAGNPLGSDLSHITAIQICAEMSVTDALPVVLQTAQQGQTLPERISAVGALGLLGGPDQVDYLNRLAGGAEERLRPAAKHALAQIAARLNRTVNEN